MYKFLLCFLLISAISFGAIELKLGSSVLGVHEVNAMGIDNIITDPGVALSVEYLFPVATGVEAGFGFGYQKNGNIARVNYSNGSYSEPSDSGAYFDSIPIFGTVKFLAGNELGVYLNIHGGYSINIPNPDLGSGFTLSSGAYYGAGVGLQLYSFLIEASYEVVEADLSYVLGTLPLDYTRICLSVGARF